jgi:hypothetical protein
VAVPAAAAAAVYAAPRCKCVRLIGSALMYVSLNLD